MRQRVRQKLKPAEATKQRPVNRDIEHQLLLNSADAAALLSIGRTTLYELVWSGQLSAVHIGRSLRFTRTELEAFVARLADRG